MAKAKKDHKAPKQSNVKLYTLSQVSEATGISMPTLQRYKKEYQERLPSVGAGRTQRYPKKALAVFEQIKRENMARRGRPKKTAATTTAAPKAARGKKSARKPAGTRKRAAAPAKPAAGAPKSEPDLLSLAQIQRLTGISYPTLIRYVKLNLDKIPHVGEGRLRRYLPGAEDVFAQLRSQSRRGRRQVVQAGKRAAAATREAVESAGSTAVRASTDLGRRIQSLEAAQAQISKQLKALVDEIRKPIQVTIKRR